MQQLQTLDELFKAGVIASREDYEARRRHILHLQLQKRGQGRSASSNSASSSKQQHQQQQQQVGNTGRVRTTNSGNLLVPPANSPTNLHQATRLRLPKHAESDSRASSPAGPHQQRSLQAQTDSPDPEFQQPIKLDFVVTSSSSFSSPSTTASVSSRTASCTTSSTSTPSSSLANDYWSPASETEGQTSLVAAEAERTAGRNTFALAQKQRRNSTGIDDLRVGFSENKRKRTSSSSTHEICEAEETMTTLAERPPRRKQARSILNTSVSNLGEVGTTWSVLILEALNVAAELHQRGESHDGTLESTDAAALGLDPAFAWSTGTDITDSIERRHKRLVQTKTKTWRNSVMGCLSCNARGLWFREQVLVEGKNRFVWRLAGSPPKKIAARAPSGSGDIKTQRRRKPSAKPSASMFARDRAGGSAAKHMAAVQSPLSSALLSPLAVHTLGLLRFKDTGSEPR